MGIVANFVSWLFPVIFELFVHQAMCYETKKCGKGFLYILMEEHYFISLRRERERRHVTWKSHDITS